MQAIVETWHVACLPYTASHWSLALIQSLGHRTSTVETMDEVLHPQCIFKAYFIALIRNFVADRIHDVRCVVAVEQHEVGDVAFPPSLAIAVDMLGIDLLEETGIAVLALRIDPHVERLCHHHHSHFIADVHLPWARCVVGSADSIAAYILEQGDLATESGLVESCSEWTKVVVQTNTLEFAYLTVELEALSRIRDFADTYLCLNTIPELTFVTELGDESIESRLFRTPQERILDQQYVVREVGRVERSRCLSNGLAFCILESLGNGEHAFVLCADESLACNIDASFLGGLGIGSYTRKDSSASKGSPSLEVVLLVEHETYWAIDACTRIPAA